VVTYDGQVRVVDQADAVGVQLPWRAERTTETQLVPGETVTLGEESDMVHIAAARGCSLWRTGRSTPHRLLRSRHLSSMSTACVAVSSCRCCRWCSSRASHSCLARTDANGIFDTIGK